MKRNTLAALILVAVAMIASGCAATASRALGALEGLGGAVAGVAEGVGNVAVKVVEFTGVAKGPVEDIDAAWDDAFGTSEMTHVDDEGNPLPSGDTFREEGTSDPVAPPVAPEGGGDVPVTSEGDDSE